MRSDGVVGLAAVVVSWLLLSTPAASQTTVSGWVRNDGTGLSEAAVYLVPLSGEVGTAADPAATIDQVHLDFLPQVVVVPPGTAVSFMNSDGVLHNVFGPGFGGVKSFDLGTYPRGETRTQVFDEAGLHVVLCHIHPEMAAYVIVAPTPYKAIAGPDGRFSIEGVPSGRYRLHAWHARHWREEHSFEITVTGNGREDIQVILGRSTRPGTELP